MVAAVANSIILQYTHTHTYCALVELHIAAFYDDPFYSCWCHRADEWIKCASKIVNYTQVVYEIINDDHVGHMCKNVQTTLHVQPYRLRLTLLNFSPSWCGSSDRRLWNPALMLCIRRRSLLLAISRRIRFSFSMFGPPPSSSRLQEKKLSHININQSWIDQFQHIIKYV